MSLLQRVVPTQLSFMKPGIHLLPQGQSTQYILLNPSSFSSANTISHHSSVPFPMQKKSCSDVQECWQAVSIERGSNLFIWSIFSFQVNVVWRAEKCLAQSFCCPHPITTSLAYWPTQRNYCLPMSCDKGEASLMVHFAHCDLNLPFAPHCLPKSGTKSLCVLNSFNQQVLSTILCQRNVQNIPKLLIMLLNFPYVVCNYLDNTSYAFWGRMCFIK